MQVSYVFFGGVSQQHFDAAQAVCEAMEQACVVELSTFIVDQAAAILGEGWDAESVMAFVENCSFSAEIDEAVQS
jgi:phosphoribosylformimino-5-aminoimidazole carboxamide ribonucleotide (ProFAR) isomerase